MRAVVVERFGALPAVIGDRPDPACPPDGAVVQVAATGVCRSDWHAWRGHDPTVTLPYVPGHEFAGRVVEVGARVRGWVGGELVTAPFVHACGRCPQCREGAPQVCRDQRQPGFTDDGSFAELVVVHRAAVNLVALPAGLDVVAAASLGCRLGTAYRAVTDHGPLEDEQWVAVHGCGGLGLAAVMVAVACGARVVAVDMSPAALRAATALGAEVAVDARHADPAVEVREATGGGAHLSLDAAGSPASCWASVWSLRPRGRHVQAGLLLGADARTWLPMDRVVADELVVAGTHGLGAAHYPGLLALIARRRIDPARLVARTIGLADVPAALADFDRQPGAGGATVAALR